MSEAAAAASYGPSIPHGILQTCSACGASKAKQAFALTGDAGEDRTQCRGCRGEAKRAANRARVAHEAGQSYTAVAHTAKAGRLHALAPQIGVETSLAAPNDQAAVPLPLLAKYLAPVAPPTQPQPAAAPTEPRPYPAIRAVLRYLPAHAEWTATDREHFLAALTATLDLEITVRPV